jgi:hypothetical protein
MDRMGGLTTTMSSKCCSGAWLKLNVTDAGSGAAQHYVRDMVRGLAGTMEPNMSLSIDTHTPYISATQKKCWCVIAATIHFAFGRTTCFLEQIPTTDKTAFAKAGTVGSTGRRIKYGRVH